jgi:hypothetical protein
VSRYGADDTYPEDADPTNAACPDCGVDFWRGEFDTCVWCGPCAQRRDAWASVQEIRSLATAVLKSDPTKLKDIA